MFAASIPAETFIFAQGTAARGSASLMSVDDRAVTAEEPVFPLPVSSFEHYMFLDDVPPYPMCFVLVLHLKGDLDRTAFESAFESSVQIHPLLRARLQVGGHDGSFQWVVEPPCRPILNWHDDDRPIDCSHETGIDLRSEAGLRVWVRRPEHATRITLQFHHSCVDGLGAVQFVGDLLAAYAQRTAAPGDLPRMIRTTELGQLRLREESGRVRDKRTHTRGRSALRVIRRLHRLLSRRPIPLAIPADDSLRDQTFPPFVTEVLNRETCHAVAKFAQSRGATANDVYLLALFLTIREWNRSHEPERPHRWLRIGMPLSMRSSLHVGMPACNRVSLMFLSRRPYECDDPQELLRSIHRDTDEIINRQFGRIFLAGIRYLCRMPRVFGAILAGKACFTTMVLANIGDIRRTFPARFPVRDGKCLAGNVVLERLDGAPPIRQGTRAGITLGTYAGELVVNLQCDPRLYSQATAERFLQHFTDQIRRLVETVD